MPFHFAENRIPSVPSPRPAAHGAVLEEMEGQRQSQGARSARRARPGRPRVRFSCASEVRLRLGSKSFFFPPSESWQPLSSSPSSGLPRATRRRPSRPRLSRLCVAAVASRTSRRGPVEGHVSRARSDLTERRSAPMPRAPKHK